MNKEEFEMIFEELLKDKRKESFNALKKLQEDIDRKAIIQNIIVKLWDCIEDYKQGNECIAITFDILCETLFNELKSEDL